MAKSSDYKTLARGVGPLYVRARLLVNKYTQDRLWQVLVYAVEKAKALEIAEVKAKAGG